MALMVSLLALLARRLAAYDGTTDGNIASHHSPGDELGLGDASGWLSRTTTEQTRLSPTKAALVFLQTF